MGLYLVTVDRARALHLVAGLEGHGGEHDRLHIRREAGSGYNDVSHRGIACVASACAGQLIITASASASGD